MTALLSLVMSKECDAKTYGEGGERRELIKFSNMAKPNISGI